MRVKLEGAINANALAFSDIHRLYRSSRMRHNSGRCEVFLDTNAFDVSVFDNETIFCTPKFNLGDR